MKTKPLPQTPEEWLHEIVLAYNDASESIPFGMLTQGRPLKDGELFHLAPHICIKFRGIKSTEKKLQEIVEGSLASYVKTLYEGEGGESLQDSPLLAFCFCYLAAHYVADLMDEREFEIIMDYCDERSELLGKLIDNL